MEKIQEIFEFCKRLMNENNIPISKNIQNEIVINTRLRKTLAICEKKGKNYVITFNSHIMETDKNILIQIMLHELIHTIKGCLNHGPKFKKYCKILNDKYGFNIDTHFPAREITYTNMTIYRYTCSKCHKQFFFYKNTKYNRVCSCGGKLKEIIS